MVIDHLPICFGSVFSNIFPYLFILFLNIFYWLWYYSCPILPLFTPFCTSPPSHIPPLYFMSMGHTYKFFGFHISYMILILPLFYTYHLCYLFSVPFPPLPPSHSPVDNLPCDLHFCGSISLLVVCFCFCFRCGC